MRRLTARKVGVQDDPELGVFIAGLAEHSDGTGEQLIFQVAHSFDEQDYVSGMDTYCISNEVGASVYGGLTECILDGSTLRLTLDPEAARDLQTDADISVELQVDSSSLTEFRNGLARIFAVDGAQPPRLIL